MKEIIQSIFKSTEERIKNPFVGAFITSWLLFNWKPILFLFLSLKNIEDKIIYIETSFSKLSFVLWYPLLSCTSYILILPYLNLIFDELLKFSSSKRNVININRQKQIIENQKQLAIEEIKLEEAKSEFRERNTHNKLVEDLQKKINELEINSETEKKKSTELLEKLKFELANRDKITSNELRNFEKRYSESREEIMSLNNKIYEKDKQIQNLQSLLNDKDLKIKRESSRILRFENGIRIIERHEGDFKYYFNAENKEQYSEFEIQKMKKELEYEYV